MVAVELDPKNTRTGVNNRGAKRGVSHGGRINPLEKDIYEQAKAGNLLSRLKENELSALRARFEVQPETRPPSFRNIGELITMGLDNFRAVFL